MTTFEPARRTGGMITLEGCSGEVEKRERSKYKGRKYTSRIFVEWSQAIRKPESGVDTNCLRLFATTSERYQR